MRYLFLGFMESQKDCLSALTQSMALDATFLDIDEGEINYSFDNFIPSVILWLDQGIQKKG